MDVTAGPARRYGAKLEAVQLVQEWVRDIGSQAGLSGANARIHSGAVGVPESRLEVRRRRVLWALTAAQRRR